MQHVYMASQEHILRIEQKEERTRNQEELQV